MALDPAGSDNLMTSGVPGAPPREERSRLAALASWDAVILVALLLVVLVASAQVEGFASTRNLGFLLLDVVPIALVALAMTFVIITGEIDLSVASTMGLTSAVMGELWTSSGLGLETIVVLCVVLGAVLGAVNGIFVTRFGLPSLAVTIGTLALYRGLAYVVLGDRAVADFPRAWTDWATSSIGSTGVPVVVVPLAILTIVFIAVLHVTPVGRALFAMGNSAEAATFSGIAVNRSKFWLFVVTGAVAGLAGVYWTLRYSSARADNASGLELAVIAGVLLGGVSIFGGKGALPGVIAGVLLLGTIRNALQLADVSSDALTVVTGVLLIASVVAPNAIAMTRERFRRRPAAVASPP